MADFESPDVGGGAESAAAAPITLTPDSLITPPGATTPVKYSEYIKGYVTASDHQAVAGKVKNQEWVAQQIARAEQIDRARAAQQQGLQGRQAPDPLAEVRGKQFVTGDMVAKMAEQVRSGDIAPIHQWATAVNQLLAENAKLQKAQGKTLEGYQSERQTQAQGQQIRSLADQAVKHAGFDPQDSQFKAIADDLRALAETEYFGFEPGPGQSRADYDTAFPARFAERVTGYRKAFRQMDRLEAESARRRLMPARGGAATPSGAFKPGFRTPAQRAEMFFPTPVNAT